MERIITYKPNTDHSPQNDSSSDSDYEKERGYLFYVKWEVNKDNNNNLQGVSSKTNSNSLFY